MDCLSINKYIDFNKMFKDCCNEIDMDDFDEGEELYDINNKIKLFFENNNLDLDIIESECWFDDLRFWFVFGLDHIDSNESDPEGGFISVTIGYNYICEWFDKYEYEQG